MSDSLNRAWALLNIRRFKEAQQAAQEALATNPDSVGAHLIIAQAALNQDQPREALEAVNRAISLEPNSPLCYIARARIYLTLNKHKLARTDCEQALELDPHDADIFGVLAWTYAAEGRWRETLEQAEHGLALDPDESNCINARTRALMFLKQNERAFQSIDSALARDPEDAYTHANAGWAKLQAGQREAALDHFTEALRREPHFEYARQGLISAMKAKSPIYGALLSYSFFMTSLPQGKRIAIILGGFIGYQIIVRSLEASGHFLLAGIVMAIWVALVLLTWAGDAIFNLLLLLNKRGRMILSTQQKWISTGVGAVLTIGFTGLGLSFSSPDLSPLFMTAIGFLLLCLPLAYAGQLRGRNFKLTLGLAAGCTVALVASAILFFTGAEPEKTGNLRDLAIYALVIFSWVGPSALKR
ncbi:tetratricopeptide repeat protein [Cerasicoccus arenae]|uniref:Tetratricopeptide repeat protein n=1 Tax=Cerasicoccus arenae TaxID=424488 RepID=A0A8J3DH49_9BACT|nr:tetratricopeptide repeat protein [Cerasicoccus arenae]MBK1857096.1 tetratricopeptide repeat protein [Cerasicoccus arenae]GHB92343.1 hypothetical protein GCM10007047_04290 [Cerasicoccus arenae]